MLYTLMTRFHDNPSPQMEEQICGEVELPRSRAWNSPGITMNVSHRNSHLIDTYILPSFETPIPQFKTCFPQTPQKPVALHSMHFYHDHGIQTRYYAQLGGRRPTNQLFGVNLEKCFDAKTPHFYNHKVSHLVKCHRLADGRLYF